jgi:hypothetical protein
MSVPERIRPRVAPVFDAVDEAGLPFFTPDLPKLAVRLTGVMSRGGTRGQRYGRAA